MRLSVKKLASVAAGAVLALGLAGSASGAQQTWTVTPGGAVSGFGTNVFAKVEDGGSVTCAQSIATGEVPQSGSGLPGEKIARVDTVTFETPGNPQDDACDGPSGIVVTIIPGGEPWYMNAEGTDPDNPNIVTGTLTSDDPKGIHASIHASDECDADFGGLDADGNPVPGVLEGTYNNETGTLTATGGNLHVTDLDDGTNNRPFECDPNLIKRGKPITINAEYFIDPKQTITPDN